MTAEFEFNDRLVRIINDLVPKKSDQMSMLMSNMVLGREAAYRRLRGDVPFSFAEACILSKLLAISLDDIAQSDKLGAPVFELKIHPLELTRYDFHKLEEHEDSFQMLLDGSVLSIQSVCNMIPYSFFFPYDNLSKFRIFKWRYQTEQKLVPSKFSDIVLPQTVDEKHKKLGAEVMVMPETTFIFDRNMFASCFNEFKYFRSLGLVSDNEFQSLKDELLELILSLEYISIQGKNNAGQRAWVYLSNIDFDSNYTYVEGKDFELAYMDGIYLMDTIVSSDPQICKMHRNWIDSLRKYSTLISVSGEMERRTFFDGQKKMIEES